MKKVIFLASILLSLMVAQAAAEEKHSYTYPNLHSHNNRSHNNYDYSRRQFVPNGYYGYRHQYDQYYGYAYPPQSVNRVPNGYQHGYYGYPQPAIISPYRYEPYCDCFIR